MAAARGPGAHRGLDPGEPNVDNLFLVDPAELAQRGVRRLPPTLSHAVDELVADEVLRLIGLNRAWTRSYSVIHNLVRNPRTPIPSVITILPRIRSKDLISLSLNRNVSENVRRQAMRLSQARSGK